MMKRRVLAAERRLKRPQKGRGAFVLLFGAVWVLSVVLTHYHHTGRHEGSPGGMHAQLRRDGAAAPAAPMPDARGDAAAPAAPTPDARAVARRDPAEPYDPLPSWLYTPKQPPPKYQKKQPPVDQSCVDSTSWFYNETAKQGCDFVAYRVAGRPKQRKSACSKRDASNVKAWTACPGACRDSCRRAPPCGARAGVRCAHRGAGLAPEAAAAPPRRPQRAAIEGLAARFTGAGVLGTKRTLAKLARETGDAALEKAAKQRALCDAAKGPRRRDRCGGPRWFLVPPARPDVAYVTEKLLSLGLCPYESSKAPPDGSLAAFFGHAFPDARWARALGPAWAPGGVVGGGVLPGINEAFGGKQSMTEIYRECAELTRADAPRAALCPALVGRGLLISFDVNGDDSSRRGARRAEDAPEPAKLKPADVPHASSIRDEIREALREREGMESSTWIVKPQAGKSAGLHMSRGMHLATLDHASGALASDAAFLAWVERHVKPELCDDWSRLTPSTKKYCARRLVVFQNFVENPSEIFGRKYDLRVWCAITSLDPLRVMILRHALPKIASTTRRLPTGEVKPIDDACAHIMLLMNPRCFNGTADEFAAGMAPDGYPKTSASRAFTERATFRDETYAHGAARRAANEDLLASTTWPRIEELVTTLVLLKRDRLLSAVEFAGEDELPANLTGRARIRELDAAIGHHGLFAFISPDFVVDDRGAPHVEEVNTKGFVVGEHARDGGIDSFFTDYGAVESLLELAGVTEFPGAAAYQAALDAAICEFCGSRDGTPKCAADEVAAMARAVHEEAHAGPDWYRLYPPLTCHARDGTCAPPAPPRSRGGRGGEAASDWPDQFKLTEAHLAAFVESRLDKAVREFLEATDTSRIHGRVVVPGHGRWPPR